VRVHHDNDDDRNRRRTQRTCLTRQGRRTRLSADSVTDTPSTPEEEIHGHVRRHEMTQMSVSALVRSARIRKLRCTRNKKGAHWILVHSATTRALQEKKPRVFTPSQLWCSPSSEEMQAPPQGVVSSVRGRHALQPQMRVMMQRQCRSGKPLRTVLSRRQTPLACTIRLTLVGAEDSEGLVASFGTCSERASGGSTEARRGCVGAR
jgi:hypothetical protein